MTAVNDVLQLLLRESASLSVLNDLREIAFHLGLVCPTRVALNHQLALVLQDLLPLLRLNLCRLLLLCPHLLAQQLTGLLQLLIALCKLLLLGKPTQLGP